MLINTGFLFIKPPKMPDNSTFSEKFLPTFFYSSKLFILFLNRIWKKHAIFAAKL